MEIGANRPPEGDLEDTQNDLTAKWDFAEWGNLKSITGFQEHTVGRGSTLVTYPIIFSGTIDDNTITQELNFGGNFPWAADQAGSRDRPLTG